MAKLVLGVNDVAYADARNAATGATTTGDVAEILEARFEVMGNFYRLKKGQIADALADAYGIAIQDLVNNRRGGDPAHGAAQKIETMFRSFLDANELQKLSFALTGLAISQAAADGINHRKKHPYAQQNKPRPAFIDTGLYRASFRAEVKI